MINLYQFPGPAQPPAPPDPVEQAFTNLGIWPAPVDRFIRNVELADHEYDDFARVAGVLAKHRLNVIVRSPDWQTWPPAVQADVLREVVGQSREIARGWMMARYPHIAREAVEQLRR